MESTPSTTVARPRRRLTWRLSPRGRSRRSGLDFEQSAEAAVELGREAILNRAPATLEARASGLALIDPGSRPSAFQQLQLAHGNAHVQRIVRSLDQRRAPEHPAPSTGLGTIAQRAGPADVMVGFNPMDIVHKLVIAIDASQIKWPDR